MKIEVFSSLPDDARDIRIEVFVDEQGFTEEFDTDDATAIHLVGYVDNKAVSTCRVIDRFDGSYFIGRIAVRKMHRKLGLGSKIVAAAEDFIKTQNGKYIYIHSQEQAKTFYEKIGYADTGERDFEEGCPHCMLIKML